MAAINETSLGSIAASKLTSAWRSKTSGFVNHVKKKPAQLSLKDAMALSRYNSYGIVSAGTKQIFLRAISIKMARYGFIRNYGVSRSRSAGMRTRRIPYNTTYAYKNHLMKQPARPFIS